MVVPIDLVGINHAENNKKSFPLVEDLIVYFCREFGRANALIGMGVKLSRLVKRLPVQRNVKILMVGLDASGKTTILYRLKLGDFIVTVPTIGFNVEAVEYKNISFTVWDIGGQEKIRPLWRHYFRNIQGLIFVVDSNDKVRISEARNALHRILKEDELRDVTLLVFANKQDLPDAMRVSEVADRLGLHLIHQPRWYIQGTSATIGQGLYEGLDWLSSNIPSKAAVAPKDGSCSACVTPRK